MSQDDTHYKNHRNDPHELHVFRASMQYLKYRCALLYFWFISVGVIDGIIISNIWCYLCPIIACVKYRVVKFSNSFFEIICHKLLPFLKMPFEQYKREGSGYEIRWIFRNIPKRGWGVILNPQIYIVDIWPLYKAFFGCLETKICDIIFRKWGGGSKAVWSFSENSYD